MCISHSVVSDSAIPWTVAHQASLSMDSPGKNTGVGSHALLQGIFPTQGSNLGLLHYSTPQVLLHYLNLVKADSLPSETPLRSQDYTGPEPGEARKMPWAQVLRKCLVLRVMYMQGWLIPP